MQHLEMHLGTKPFKFKSVFGFRAVTPDAFQSRCLGLATLQFDLKHFYTPSLLYFYTLLYSKKQRVSFFLSFIKE